MSLKHAAYFGFTRTAVAIVASFLSVKITSVYLGPAGIGVLSQLHYFMQMSVGVLANGVNVGVVRMTAEYSTDDNRRRIFISTVVRALLVGGLTISVAIVLLAPTIAARLLDDPRYTPVVMLFGALYLCGLFPNFLGSLANGAKDYKTTALINIAGVLTSLGLFAVLCPIYGVWGGLLAAALSPFAAVSAAFLLARGRPWLEPRAWANGFSRNELYRIASFVPMAATGAALGPLTQIIVRDLLADHAGMGAVGLLQGVWRLSDLYLGIITSTLSMYFLPRFSEIRLASELRREIGRGLLLIVPGVALISAAIYLLRDFLIMIIFTREFLPMRDLFAWQMAGNVLKMASWVFGFVLLAKSSPLVFGALEAFMAGFWIVIAHWLVPENHAIGALQAYVINYAVYFLVTACLVSMRLRSLENGSTNSS